MMRLRFLFLLGWVSLCRPVVAQHFQFSQYNFSAQRVNPALVSSSDYASVGLLYRNQATGGDFNLSSTFVSGNYPFLNRRSGKRWSGIGVSLLDDRSGQGGLFTTQEAALSYAINVYLARYQILSVGMKALYQQRRLDLNGLHTGSQYIPDRGFDESVSNGENLGALKNNFFTTSLGLYWQQTDPSNNKLAYWGISFFDFNKPQDNFLGAESSLSTTMVASAGLRIFEQNNVSVMPEILYTRSAANNVFNLGTIISYNVRPAPNQLTGRFDLITKYVVGRSGIIGIQLHKENISVGLSYDFPVVKTNVGNTGAFEIGIELRRLVDPKLKAKRARERIVSQRNKAAQRKPVITPVKPKKDSTAVSNVVSKGTDSTAATTPPRRDLQTTLKQKQDSVLANAQAGDLNHEPLIIEKVTLHFNFEFNSNEVDESSAQYLNDLGEALLESPNLKVKLTGHTDNIGSDRFNQRLSVQRAENVRQYLIQQGVDPSRITADGKGKSEPLNDNSTEELRAINRRVDLTIVYE